MSTRPTQVWSFHTKRPGISPAMILVKMLGMAGERSQ
jgi:hypothetical protein